MSDVYPSPDYHAAQLGQMNIEAARKELSGLIDMTAQLEGPKLTAALDYNARLVTCLRKRGVKIWGTDG